MKRKYPMIVTYNKYLSDLTEELQTKEVELFQKFLIQNQNLQSKTFDIPVFKTGKKSGLTLDMNNFIQGEQTDTFWQELLNLDTAAFPSGKPTDLPIQEDGAQGAFAALERNPLFSGVLEQIRSSVSNIGDSADIESIMSSPDFKHIVDNIRGGLASGKYKLKDLTAIVDEIVKTVQKDLDPETQETLQTVSNSIRAVERGEAPDINKIMGVVSKLKLS
jgi:hypothetical protein